VARECGSADEADAIYIVHFKAYGSFGRYIQAKRPFVLLHIWERGVWVGLSGVCSISPLSNKVKKQPKYLNLIYYISKIVPLPRRNFLVN
jgi:hypothetical protein